MGTYATAERRELQRRPFQGTVVLADPGDADGYEADGVDLGVGGMGLRTEFLPDVGSELECRFALEDGEPVAARAQVTWARDEGRDAGVFGLRFTSLPSAAERAIRASVPAPLPVDEPPPAARPRADDTRARLHIAGMDAPLRARVRSMHHDAVVLGSELSFLRLGERVEVEHNGARTPGGLEAVDVEVDPHTRVARLVLTVALDPAGADGRRHAAVPPATNAVAGTVRVAAAPRPRAAARDERPARHGAVDAGARETAPFGEAAAGPAVVHSTLPRRDLAIDATAAGHDAWNVASEPTAAPADDHAPDAAARAVPSRHALARAQAPEDHGPAVHAPADDADVDAAVAADARALRRTPPAWLVGIVRAARTAARAAIAWSRPALARLVALVSGLYAAGMRWVRTRRGLPVDAAPQLANVAPGLRRQQTIAPPEPAPAAQPRRRIGLYVLAGAGIVAIAFALTTGSRAPRATPPRPQAAVASVAAAPEPEAQPGDPTAETGAALGAEASAAGTTDPAAAAPVAERAHASPAPQGPRAMPPDLVGAARSRNARVDDVAPAIRLHAPARRADAPVAPRAAAVASNTAAATATTAPVARTLGNPTVQNGTVLRLRMDGAITGLAGGPGAGNTIAVRVAGRRSLDMAAPLVRQDVRLVNAGVYNRAQGAELILRFRDAVPMFAARARGTTLEIVLAPAARGARRAP